MRQYRLLLALAVVSGGISSVDAFQLPGRKYVAAVKCKSEQPSLIQSQPTASNGLLSKLNRLSIPSLRKSTPKPIQKKKVISNKQILSLVTTCCLTWFLRPATARATFLMDPTTLTYDEVPSLGFLPNSLLGMSNLGFVEVFRPRRSLAFLGLSLFVAASLVSWVYSGIVYWMTFRSNYLRHVNLGNLIKRNNKHARFFDEQGHSVIQEKHVGWDEYTKVLLKPFSHKKAIAHEHKVIGKHNPPLPALNQAMFSSDLQMVMFLTANDETADEDDKAKMQKAAQFFREEKYKLHHRKVHVPRSEIESPSYLDTLSINEETKHDVPEGYLDTLSDSKQSTWGTYKKKLDTKSQAHSFETEKTDDKLQIMKNLLTWEDYKHLVGELQDRKNEVNELKQEVSHLQSLLHIEQSIHQAVPLQEEPSKDQTSQELDELSWLHQEYENTVQESFSAEKEDEWEEVDDGYMGSGIK